MVTEFSGCNKTWAGQRVGPRVQALSFCKFFMVIFSGSFASSTCWITEDVLHVQLGCLFFCNALHGQLECLRTEVCMLRKTMPRRLR